MYMGTQGCAIKLPEGLWDFGRLRAISDSFWSSFGRFWAISVAFGSVWTSFGQPQTMSEQFLTFPGHFGVNSGERKDYYIGSLIEQPRVYIYYTVALLMFLQV